MQSDQVLEVLRQSLKVCILLCAPVMVFGLIVGVTTNVLQAVTQISETTLAVVPKLLAMFGALVLFSPWMIDVLIEFTTHTFESIPSLVR